MRPEEADLVARALAFALESHAGQTRKGTSVPYVTHCLRVAALVLENGGSAAQAATGLLHDTLEDCDDVTEQELRRRFGPEIAEMVATLSDTMPGDTADEKSPWRVRKEAYVETLARSCGRTQLVAACDKLDNLRALVEDLESVGIGTLERFSASPRQTRWYYESVRRALSEAPVAVTRELDELLATLARHVPEASVER